MAVTCIASPTKRLEAPLISEAVHETTAGKAALLYSPKRSGGQ
jgi:hypothetical protein